MSYAVSLSAEPVTVAIPVYNEAQYITAGLDTEFNHDQSEVAALDQQTRESRA